MDLVELDGSKEFICFLFFESLKLSKSCDSIMKKSSDSLFSKTLHIL